MSICGFLIFTRTRAPSKSSLSNIPRPLQQIDFEEATAAPFYCVPAQLSGQASWMSPSSMIANVTNEFICWLFFSSNKGSEQANHWLWSTLTMVSQIQWSYDTWNYDTAKSPFCWYISVVAIVHLHCLFDCLAHHAWYWPSEPWPYDGGKEPSYYLVAMIDNRISSLMHRWFLWDEEWNLQHHERSYPIASAFYCSAKYLRLQQSS
jgi:hypothetical protein